MTDGYLLIAWHGRTGTSEALAASAAEGAAANGSLLPAAGVTPDDLLAAAGYLFVCPENLASMSGEMKEMFDRCYYPVLGKLNGRPFATIIAAGSDGEGAQRQIDRIAKGWRLKRVAEPWIVNTEAQSPEAILAAKTLDPATLQTAREMGEALGEAVTSGML